MKQRTAWARQPNDLLEPVQIALRHGHEIETKRFTPIPSEDGSRTAYIVIIAPIC
jgi:hypothetical protein